jgi:23S rRNA (uridine2552-2'-O)-methyltransferase
MFQGEGFDELVREAKKVIQKVLARKPDASRTRSRKVYLLENGLATGVRLE